MIDLGGLEVAPAPRRSNMATRAAATVVVAIFASLFLLFIFAPVAGLVASGGASGIARFTADDELRASLVLTVTTATVATILGVLGGTPLAYLLARRAFRGRAIVAAVMDLPLVIPHPVAGIALLLVLGRGSPIGGALYQAGLRIAGSATGIVCAMLFVSAPLYVSAAREAFARVDARYEFGAIVILTYNPKVVSVLSYERFTSYGMSEALPVAAVLVLFALVPLVALRALRDGEPLPR
jgi:molybdate/tungstate transport system permease protein